MKITKTLRIFLILLSVMMVLPLFACGETPEETTTKAPETTEQKPTEPTETTEKTEKTETKETTETPVVDTTVPDSETDAVVTTEADTAEASDESVETTAETEETTVEETTECAHGDTTLNELCQEVCNGCGEILATDVHPIHVESFEDGEDGKRTYTVICDNCKAELYSYTMQLGENAPELIITADKLAAMVKTTGTRISDAKVASDGSFVTIYNTPMVKGDSFFTVYEGDGSVTGQYMLIKYRTTSKVAQQIWIGANNGKDAPANGDSFYIKHQENNACGGYVADGEWRVTIIDLSKVKEGRFNPETEGESAGKYCADYIKWDIFDMPTTQSESVDVAYIAMADDLGELLAIDGVKEYVFVQKLLGGIAVAEPLNSITDNPFFDPAYIVNKVANEGIATLKKDETNNGMPYAELKSISDSGEQKFFLWQDTENMIKNSGNYLGYLYRRSATSDVTIDFFINSNLIEANRVSSRANIPVISDGTWQLKIIDISGMNNKDNEAYYDPAMGFSSFRFDYLNGNRTIDETIDFAFIATFDTEAQAAEVLSAYFMSYFNGGAQICKHTSVTNVSYVSDDNEDTVYAIETFDCLVCRKTGLVRRAAFGTALENVDADANISFSGSTLLRVENCVPGVWKSGDKAYPTAGFVTPSAEGTVTANGWAGVNGDVAGAAYMVVDAEGNVLRTWTEVDGNFDPEHETITSVVLSMGHGIAPIGRRFKIAADVNAFAGQTVNVIYAVIPAGIPEGSNDRYVPVFEIQGIKVPAAGN